MILTYKGILIVFIIVIFMNVLARLRLSRHDLDIERGRYTNINIENRTCEYCNMKISLFVTCAYDMLSPILSRT